MPKKRVAWWIKRDEPNPSLKKHAEGDYCYRCKTPLTDENWMPSQRNRRWLCNNCWRKAAKDQRKRHPTVSSAASSRHRKKIKTELFEKLGGAICVNCGCDDPRVLEINHKNRGGTAERKKTKSYSTNLYRAIVRGERNPEDFDVRCRVCNTLYDVQERLNVKGHIVTWKP